MTPLLLGLSFLFLGLCNGSATPLQSQNSTFAKLASALHTIPPFMAKTKFEGNQSKASEIC